MIKLTDNQRAVLTAAAARADGTVHPLPPHVRGGGATKVIHALLRAGLITEMPSTITPAGRAAIIARPETKPNLPAALEKLTAAQAATAITVITGQRVTSTSFRYKHQALARLAAVMTERHLGLRDVLHAAGIEAIAPDGRGLSGLGILEAPQPSAPPAAGKPQDTKQDQLIAMLKRRQGASVAEISKAFGWQPHTVRGTIAGALRKRLGLTVTAETIAGRGCVYRIAD